MCEDCTKSSIKIKIENAENDSIEYEEKISENLYDKIVPESVFIDGVMGTHDDMKYMQVPSGTVKEVEVDKRINASTVVSFLLIIFAMVQMYGKIGTSVRRSSGHRSGGRLLEMT